MVLSLDEERRIVAEEEINSQEGCRCKSNIAGNMGEGAVNVLQAHHIDVILGASKKTISPPGGSPIHASPAQSMEAPTAQVGQWSC
jgi:hypothetical protein